MTKPPTQYPHKVYGVPVKLMVVPAVGVIQRELRQAKVNHIAAHFDRNKLDLLKVNKRNQRYEIFDGQHRYMACVQLGLDEELIECKVYEDLTDQQMADLFCGLNTRSAVAALDFYFIGCTANYARETGIRRIVESNGQKIARRRGTGITAIGAVNAVYDHSGEAVLGQVVRTINLGFGGDPLGFDAALIQGIGLVYNRWNGRTSEKALASRLGGVRHGAREVLRRSEELRVRTGKHLKQCVAATIVDIYNKGEGPGTSKTRLPSWWKEDPPAPPVRA